MLGKGGETTNVAEDDHDFAAVTVENTFVAARDDQVRQLRRQKTAQLTDPLDLGDLRGHAGFQLAISTSYLLGTLTQFTEQSSVFNCDHRMSRKVLQNCDLLSRRTA